MQAAREDIFDAIVQQARHQLAGEPLGLVGVVARRPAPLMARNDGCTVCTLNRIDRGCCGCRISISATRSGSIRE